MIVLFAEPLSHFRHFFRFALSSFYRPPHGPTPDFTARHHLPLLPLLDGEDHPATETVPEITLEDRQSQRCCQHLISLVSCLDADVRLSRKKSLRRERQAQVRARLTALPFHPTPPEPRLSSPCFRTDRDRQCHSHAHKLPWPHAQPVIDKDDVLAAAPLYLPLRQQDVIHVFFDHVRNIGDDMHKC